MIETPNYSSRLFLERFEDRSRRQLLGDRLHQAGAGHRWCLHQVRRLLPRLTSSGLRQDLEEAPAKGKSRFSVKFEAQINLKSNLVLA